MNFPKQKFDGALLAARYAFMPNKLRYCGGDNNSEIFNYAAENQSDQGLKDLLEEFATMYPYLKLIAEANKIIDPFNYKVVEAYWIGNELLENVSLKNFYRYLIDAQKLKKKFKPKLLEKVFGKMAVGAKPHHSWHVFSIPKRTGHYPVEHTLETMDKCRIGWAKVKSMPHTIRAERGLVRGQKSPPEALCLPLARDAPLAQKVKSGFAGQMIVEYQPLVLMGDRLALGEPVEKEVWSEINEKAFIKEPKAGDFVSVHWGWVCDFLTGEQVENLEKWTKYNLNLANLGI